MPWVAAAGAVVGSIVNSNAVGSAANQQAGAARDATELQSQQFQQQQRNQQPWLDAGGSGISRLQQLLGLQNKATFNSDAYLTANPDARAWLAAKQAEGDPKTAFDHFTLANAAGDTRQGSYGGADFGSLTKNYTGESLTSDPGYQFGLREGTRATERSESAKGGQFSGATLKALQRFGTDYGGTKFNEGFNRDASQKDRLFNQLSGISGTGQIASNQLAQAGQNYANQASSALYGAANAGAGASLARGNLIQNTGNQLASMWNNRKTTQPAGGGIWDPGYDGADGGWTGGH